QQAALQARNPDAADLASDAPADGPRPLSETPATPPRTTAAASTTPGAAATGDARYLLQAGSFSGSGDAEALKARIALLGLSARVESGQ
ncbi:hypothetical protein SB719_20500, partial [Pantoea sp. SIMBA_079]|uniref:SPOR domain-containing protein n=1 Tax=Pantoea sp. SIMBA_079 TaxID=3085817 RepID=UPI0039913BE8